MNSQIFTRATLYTSALSVVLLGSLRLSAEEWKFDFSRRSKPATSKELVNSSSDPMSGSEEAAPKSFIAGLFDSSEPAQEIVILNTETGFVPTTVRVRQNGVYRLHVVNVNEREKNVSFVLDAFSEHHATYFGKIKTFEISPKRNGVFRFVSPETSAQGRLVVYPAAEPTPGSPEVRQPAAENE